MLQLRSVKRIDLKKLILLFTFASVTVTFITSCLAFYHVQRTLLVQNTLESNQRYAAKLASSAQDLLLSAQYSVALSAGLLSDLHNFETTPDQETFRLVKQAKLFNSAIVVNSNAEVISVYPKGIVDKGYVLPEYTRQSFDAREPLITRPFRSISGNTLISISHPIWSKEGIYLGYISGTIYLNQKGALAKLMQEHFFSDDSYLYVVDEFGEILFHVDKNRIGENVAHMPLVQSMLSNGNGAEETTNSEGIDVIAGYSQIPLAKWGVVVQRPKANLLSLLKTQMLNVLFHVLPFFIFGFLGIWFCSYLISKPLRQLSKNSLIINNEDAQNNIVNINAWYFEAIQLKIALLSAIGMFHEKIYELDTQSQTDPLTKLLNRRGLQRSLEKLAFKQPNCTVITIDIDHFKRVNDNYGHDTGDKVIQALAEIIKHQIPEPNIACRVGGEEFLIILPNTDSAIGEFAAHSLCQAVSNSPMPKVHRVTVSIGVSHIDAGMGYEDFETVIEQADQALYQAKQNGRNRVCIYSSNTIAARLDE